MIKIWIQNNIVLSLIHKIWRLFSLFTFVSNLGVTIVKGKRNKSLESSKQLPVIYKPKQLTKLFNQQMKNLNSTRKSKNYNQIHLMGKYEKLIYPLVDLSYRKNPIFFSFQVSSLTRQLK